MGGAAAVALAIGGWTAVTLAAGSAQGAVLGSAPAVRDRHSGQEATSAADTNRSGDDNGQGPGGEPGNAGNGRGHGYGRGCHYPPNGAAQVVLEGPDHTHDGRTVTLTGHVTRNGCHVPRAAVGLYGSSDGRTGWTKIGETSTDREGAYSFDVPSYAEHHYQVVMAGERDGVDATASAVLRLRLR